MADSPATSGTCPGDSNAGFLATSIEIPHSQDTRKRSCSASSATSTVTIIDNHSHVPILDNFKVQEIQRVQRRRTQVAEVKISWWQCLKGVLFGPQVTMRAATKSIVIPEIEDDDDVYEKTECWWIFNVHALSKTGVHEHQEARCTFDTGCIQGNMISKDFALALGFTDSDYQPLKRHEKHGGTSATGHAHMPEGALYITWYHNSSPRLYKGMRFLVSADTQSQLIIGARSIQKHRLLSAPNLSVGDDRAGVTVMKKGSDKAFDKLRSEEAKLKNDLATIENQRKNAQEHKNNTDFKIYNAKCIEKDAQLRLKTLEVEHYNVDAAYKKNSSSKLKAVLGVIEKEMQEFKRSGNSSESVSSPTVRILAPNGHVRRATGS